MTPLETVRAVKVVVASLGGAFMTDPVTTERGRELGYRSWSFYAAGRGGVLGEVDADVVTAAFAFFPPERLRLWWEGGLTVATPAAAAAAYADCCAAWGRRHLGAGTELDQFCSLAERVVDSADVAGMPLFAGWRAHPRPSDSPARTAHLLHLLREQRGGAHIAAVLAAGLTPLQAVLSSDGGEKNASFFGWPEPYPDPTAIRERRSAVEEATDAVLAPAYAVLDEGERKEFHRLAVAIAEATS